ncbi:LamG-like jellyroll fold domain-containing protein [Actinoplanes sp. NPDC051346]|uniref:LamG-like jellyroll fold domain-containing protein n=1 Tax=Actinoplanes sp. NPDC051346 TaxID=3155048 RepID=UPI00342F934C
MRHSVRLLPAVLTVLVLPAVVLPTAGSAAPAAPVTVARYTFDSGAVAAGRVADRSGRGAPLVVRSADRGRVHFNGTTADKYAAFPATCAVKATVCPRALLEGTDDPDLDPGTRLFRWGATVRLTKAQVTDSSNVMQKGVSATDSQWKLQIGARQAKAHCVVAGQGAKPTVHIVRSTVGVADNAWHDIMCQRSGSRLTIYVDGRERGHVSIPASLSIHNDLPLRIGGPNFHTRSDMYHGLLDDVWARLG